LLEQAMKNTIKIKSARVTALRAKRGFSQKQLAGKVLVDAGTVSRWERGTIDKVRPDTFGRLKRALNATENDLCGEGPLPDAESAQPESAREQMNLSIDSACRNALHLVARRYGVTRQQIVEVAPLLFFIAAEQSLDQRRNSLRLFEEAADSVVEATPHHLPKQYPVDSQAVDEEKKSIKALDLFADNVFAPDDFRTREWDSDLDNPFATFLSEALRRISQSAEPLSWNSSGSPSYQVCVDEAAAIVGGDAEATHAILSGVVTLHDMAKALPKASPTERAQWARAELENFRRNLEELGEVLGLEQSKPDTSPSSKLADGAKS